MAEIKAFKALRFTQKAGDIKELACPPYDIISEDERKNYLKRNESNIIRLELPRDGEDPYAVAGEALRAMLEDGILAEDGTPALYIYEEKFTVSGQNYSFKGVICAVKAEPFENGVVLPHEQTLSKAKTDRFNLMCATNCNFSNIYSLYMDDENRTAQKLDELSSGAPVQSFTDEDGVTHSLWIITDGAAVASITKDFSTRKLYIADGHHRYETALKYSKHTGEGCACGGCLKQSDFVMMMLVDMQNPGLVVFPTHRIIRDLKDFSASDLLSKCGEYFTVEKVEKSESAARLQAEYDHNRKAFLLYDGIDYHLLTLKDIAVMDGFMPEASKALKGLDVSVLHTLVLERVLGIDKENMANQINLTYTKSADDAVAAVDSGANCAFIINPTRVDEIRDVAAAGEKMPQKSTYFYPKLITGMVMRKMD